MPILLFLQVTSIERILQYTSLPQEPLHGVTPPGEWPTNRAIQLIDVSLKYPPENSYALMKINIDIKPNEKVNVNGNNSGHGVQIFFFPRFTTSKLWEITSIKCKTSVESRRAPLPLYVK